MNNFWQFWVYLPRDSLERSNAVEFFREEKENQGIYDLEWKALAGVI